MPDWTSEIRAAIAKLEIEPAREDHQVGGFWFIPVLGTGTRNRGEWRSR